MALLLPGSGEAQTCAVVFTNVATSPGQVRVLKQVDLAALTPMTATAACTAGMSYGAATNCRNTFISTLYATAPTTALPAAASCVWVCSTTGGGNCTVTIDNMDGLPVELMDFEVETGDASKQDGGRERRDIPDPVLDREATREPDEHRQ